MIKSLITTKTLFDWANANENNGFSISFLTGNLLNSGMLCDCHTCPKEQNHDAKVDNHVFDTIHSKRHRFYAHLKYFNLNMYRNKYQ